LSAADDADELALQRALNSRDKGTCRFPGCTHKRYTDAHHIHHWARGGETKMSNLVTLCRFHHRKVHEGAVIVQVLDDGAIRFTQPNGECFDSVAPHCTQPPGNWRQLPAMHERAGIHIDAKTAACRDGGYVNYGMAMDVLMNLPREVSAETSACIGNEEQLLGSNATHTGITRARRYRSAGLSR
jgi:hypothetical protein